jgi:hypothetical protein
MYKPSQPQKPWNHVHINNQWCEIFNWLIQFWRTLQPDFQKYSWHNHWHSASLIINLDYLFQFCCWGMNLVLYSISSAKRREWGSQVCHINQNTENYDRWMTAWNHFMIQLIQSAMSKKNSGAHQSRLNHRRHELHIFSVWQETSTHYRKFSVDAAAAFNDQSVQDCQSYFHYLNVCDFHLWEKLKPKAYSNNKHILEVLHIKIWYVMVEITGGKLCVT